ncbi:uncharacterized protein [Haliotis asinina]|uniref:uncharacterized protein n=1 Tax=Haliotis asinina TaxID=109174 RepID=UPI003531F462
MMWEHCAVMKSTLHTVFLMSLMGGGPVTGRPTPTYVWPLGNTTLNTEVMARLDAAIPDDGQCFRFRQGYPELPYDAITLTGDKESHIDISLDGNLIFKDITISFLAYPEGPPEGTLINYLYKTGNIIKVSMLENYLFISFWDEYGVDVGSTALPDVLIADTWCHIVITREFLTGRIKVFNNGKLLENLDDDFPNEIQLPSEGALRLGKSLDEPEDPFIGRISCFQLYSSAVSPEEAGKTKENCFPNAWKHTPQVFMERRFVDGEVRQCVSDGSKKASPSCDVITMHCLAGGKAWNSVMATNNWASSSLDTAYFSVVSRDSVPEPQNEHLLGTVSTKNRHVCSRLCMRVLGCKSFAVGGYNSTQKSCILIDRQLESTVARPGWKYYVMKN